MRENTFKKYLIITRENSNTTDEKLILDQPFLLRKFLLITFKIAV